MILKFELLKLCFGLSVFNRGDKKSGEGDGINVKVHQAAVENHSNYFPSKRRENLTVG